MKKNIISMINDITIPEDEFSEEKEDILNTIFEVFEFDIDSYIIALLKKISLLYRPFDTIFLDELVKNYNKTISNNFILFSDNTVYFK